MKKPLMPLLAWLSPLCSSPVLLQPCSSSKEKESTEEMSTTPPKQSSHQVPEGGRFVSGEDQVAVS